MEKNIGINSYQTKNTKNEVLSFFNKYGPISTFVIITIIFLCLTGYLIHDLVQKKNYIHKDSCNKPMADWQVEHGIEYTDIIETKTNISNLTQAVDYCNNNDKCNRFTFSNKNKNMRIITLTSSGIRNINYDTYTRQTGITYVNPNNTRKLYTKNNIDYTNKVSTPNITTEVTNGYLGSATTTSSTTSTTSGY